MGWLIDYEAKKKEKELIQGFLAAKDDKEKLNQWKQANKEKEIKKDTFGW